MQMAMSSALATIYRQDLRFLRDFNSRDFAWLLIGALLAAGAMWLYSRRRRRWL